MQTIDNQGLAELLKANPDIAYVATAITPWHAIGVVASVLSQGLDKKRGVVLITMHNTYGQPLIDKSNFKQLGDNVDVYISSHNHNKIKIVTNIFRFIMRVKNGDSIISVISPRKINLRVASVISLNTNNTKVELIKYDVGLATYFPQNKVEACRNIITLLNRIIDGFTIPLYSALHVITDACLFFQDRSAIAINNEIIPFYKQAIETTSDGLNIENLSLFEDSIIICPNAWIRDAVLDSADTQIVLRLLDYLKAQNIKFVIKLHPRDTWSREIYKDYSDYIYDISGVSMEAILSSVKIPPRALIGFSSTVLVTAKLFWNLNTINIADIVDNSKLGKMYWNEKYYFKKIFGDYVTSPQSLDELKLII